MSFELKDDEFYIHLNQDNLVKEGKDLIKKFLIILQTYKSSGAIDRASKFYSKFSEVNEFFLKVRELVILKKKPRRIELNNNLVRYNENCIEPLVYPETFEGIIKSYSDRWQATPELIEGIKTEWSLTKEFLRV